jgi:hypothetical protein
MLLLEKSATNPTPMAPNTNPKSLRAYVGMKDLVTKPQKTQHENRLENQWLSLTAGLSVLSLII